MIICSFAAREPAKPLNDAQMCGSFLFYRYSKFFPVNQRVALKEKDGCYLLLY